MATKRRREKIDDISVPGISDDAAERKRVLNVLAQRRYSELIHHELSPSSKRGLICNLGKKKRERLEALEAQVKASSSSSTDTAQGECLNQVNDSPEDEES